MHGRVKSKISKDEEIKEKNEEQEKATLLSEGFKEVISKRNSIENYDKVLLKSSELLILNPDIYTLWNIRRNILLHKQKELPLNDFKEICKKENYLVEKCLAINPKSYSAWYQRAWVMNHMPEPDWANELSLCSKFLNYDERNFHCWDHRRFVVEKSRTPPGSELQFTLQKIHQNFSNYSAWHNRSRLWEERIVDCKSQSHGSGNNNSTECDLSSVTAALRDHVIATDRELVHSAIFTDPFDQSAWFYLRWLLSVAVGAQLTPQQLTPKQLNEVIPTPGDRLTPAPAPSAHSLYADWLKEGEVSDVIGPSENNMVAVDGDSSAVGGICDPTTIMLYARRASPASLIFALDTYVRRIVCVDRSMEEKFQEDVKEGRAVDWFDTQSRQTFYFKLTLNGTEYPGEMLGFRPLYPDAVDRGSADSNFVADDTQQLYPPSDVWTIRNMNSDWTSLIDEALTFTLTSWTSPRKYLTVILKSGTLDAHNTIVYSEPHENLLQNESNLKVLKLLEENTAICDQLTELEPNNKWSLLTWIWIAEQMVKFNERKIEANDKLAKGMNECVEKLLKMDPDRKGYYNYLRSKFLLESKLTSLRAAKQVKGLTACHHQDGGDDWSTKDGVQLDLKRSNLYTIAVSPRFRLDCLLLSSVDVSFNNLNSLSWCRGLSCLKRLGADDNNLTDTRGIENCRFLEYISLKNNRIETAEKDLTGLADLTNLECLILKGNPLCYSPHFPEELYACLPSTLGVLKDYSDEEEIGDA